MHVLILTAYFRPEIGAAADLYYELAETLAERGHQVTVVTGFPRYRLGTERQNGFLRKEQVGRSRVVRVASSPFDQGGPMRRGLDHLYLAPSLVMGGLLAGKPDVILAYSPPLTLGASAWALSKLRGVPWIINVQDLFPQYAIDVGLLTSPIVIRAFEALERFVYRTAHGITVNSPGGRVHAVSKGATSERVRVISNWVDVDFIRPGPKDNAFRRECRLRGKFVVQYAGTMGYQQDLDTLIEAAQLLRDAPDICFQLIGDGVERERLQVKVMRLGLRNVVFTPFQPRERYPLVLQSADACVVTLRKEVRTPAIPSKLLGIMAAGKPVLISADPSGDAPAIVRDVGCGILLPPGEPAQFAEAVLTLKRDPAGAPRMGRRGRLHAQQEFSRQVGAARYEELFARLVNTGPLNAAYCNRLQRLPERTPTD